MPARRILIVEDNADSRWAMRLLLEYEGHHVDEAEDGVAGLDAALNGTYDIGLLDLHVPLLDGYALARKIRAAGRPMVLIALTGAGLDRDRETALDAGFDAYILKPISPQALMALIADPPVRRD